MARHLNLRIGRFAELNKDRLFKCFLGRDKIIDILPAFIHGGVSQKFSEIFLIDLELVIPKTMRNRSPWINNHINKVIL